MLTDHRPDWKIVLDAAEAWASELDGVGGPTHETEIRGAVARVRAHLDAPPIFRMTPEAIEAARAAVEQAYLDPTWMPVIMSPDANTCATCRHWWQRETPVGEDDPSGYCQLADCAWATKAKPIATDECGVGVLTHRSFGCNRWKAKDVR